MKTDKIIRKLRYYAEAGAAYREVNPEETKQLLTEAADRLEELDERVAIMSAEATEPEKDLAIIGQCRTGKVKKYVGRGLVILNYQWWRERIEKTGFRAVPTDEDMEGAEHDRSEGKTDRAD